VILLALGAPMLAVAATEAPLGTLMLNLLKTLL
jgi:hypothetical protein